jgi:uncharacterized protein DUF2867
MRIPNSSHEAHLWRIHEIAPDFTLEDVWALPVHGDADDFQKLIEMVTSLDPAKTTSRATRLLFDVRERLGSWFGWDDTAEALPIPGTDEISLADRLPADLRDTAADVDFRALPAVPLYRTDDEFAAEASNRTVHGVIHLSWVDQGDGRHQGHLAIYVKPRGRFGQAYMWFIKPFRYRVVYPALMRQFERAWSRRVHR